jgi:rSAM/selenodomain-associated transferase 2
MTRRCLSVVIPALDEGAAIEDAIRSVRGSADEILVVDGGSRDETRERARAAGALVLEARGGRGPQLDAGARRARGDWLLFLHADTRLEPGWADELLAVGPRFAGGSFRFAVASPRPAFRLVESGVRLRVALFALPYGDQALFARADAYRACGGFPPLPLMEDVAFVRRLRRQGPLARLRSRAFTSPRRWDERGIARTTAANLRTLALYAAGRSPDALAAEYRRPPIQEAE